MIINNVQCHFCKQPAEMTVLDVEFKPTEAQDFYNINFVCHCPLCDYNFTLCVLAQTHAAKTISMEEFHRNK